MKKILLASCFFVNSWCSIPRYTTPVGIPNEHGTCYASAALQLFQAVHFACPELINSLITDPEYTLLYSYGTMLNKITYWSRSKRRGFTDKMPAFDATNFLYQFAQQNPKRNKHIILEKRTDNQGATEELSIGEWEKDLGGGQVTEVSDLLLKELGAAAAKHGFRNNLLATCSYKQFTSALSIDADGKQLLDLHKLNPASKDSPRFLATYCKKRKSFLPVTSVQVKTENTQKLIEYKLLALTYYTPTFDPKDGSFFNNHGFTIARHGNHWYLCDGHVITPFPNAESCMEWMQQAAKISYSGPGLPPHAYTAVTPEFIIYERVEIDTKETGNR